MLRSLNIFPIGVRVFSAFALVTTIAALVILTVSFDYYQTLVARDQAVKISFDAQQTANDQQVSLQRMNALLQTRYAEVFATTAGSITDPSLEASGALINSDILTREDDFAQSLQIYQQNFTFARSPNMQGVRAIILSDDPNNRIGSLQQEALTTVARSEWPGYKALQDQALRLLNPTTNALLVTNPLRAYAEAYPIFYQANQHFLALKLDWQRIVSVAQAIGELVTNVGVSQTQPIVQATLVALALTFFVISLIGLVVNVTITRPLSKLAVLTHRIGDGDLSARAAIWGRDEIYLVASSMNAMLDDMVHLLETSETRSARLQFQVDQFIADVSGIGRGDLRAQADVTLADLGPLALAFNFMMNEFASLIREVKCVAYKVVTSSVQTTHLIQQLVTSAGEHIAQIQEAAQEVEAMVTQSKRVAHRAAELSIVAMQGQEATREGAHAVRKTVEGVGRINTTMRATAKKVQSLQMRSSAIDEISEAVGSLAQRIHRLSLDAAIQVGIAGASNTGFAKVVDEIRTLAQKAQEDATRIRGIAHTVNEEITEVQRATLVTAGETEHLTRFAAQAGKALEASLVTVGRQADEIQEMAQVAAGQGHASQRVVEVMRLISASTRHSSAITQEVASQVKMQGHLIGALRTSVETFTVRDEQTPDRDRSMVKVSTPRG